MKILNKFWPKKDYMDFTNDSWKSNFLIGLKITTRPYHKWALFLAFTIFLSGFVLWIIPMINPVTSAMASIKFLGKWG